MEANSSTPQLFDAIKTFREIRVDDYQRTYAWTQDEITELLADLRETVRTKDNHFFGTLIFQSPDDLTAKVVDGQQRLTTIFILVSALRDAIDDLGPDVTTLPITETRRFPIPVLPKALDFIYADLEDGVPRFHTNPFLDKLLQECVFDPKPHQKKVAKKGDPISRAMRKAIYFIRESVEKELSSQTTPLDKLALINDYLDSIRSRFLVLKVQTSKLTESLEIFLTLNNRGLPLGASDLVRGLVMSLRSANETEDQQKDTYRAMFEEWKEVTDKVDDAEVYLRHYLVATSEDKVQKKVIYRHVETALEGKDELVKKVKANRFWDDLVSSAEYYAQTITPSMGGDAQYHIEIMGRILKSYRIVCFSILKRYLDLHNKTRVSGEMKELIRLVYVLSVRWVMAGGNAQVLEDYFQTVSTQLRNGVTYLDIASGLKKKITDLKLDVKQYMQDEGDSDFIGKAILHAIDRKTSNNNDYKLDKSIHLEHIAPQTPTSQWKRVLLGDENAKDEEYGKLTSSLGNLTLLDEFLNIPAKQKQFMVKCKDHYKDATPLITKDLEDLKGITWNTDSIGARLTWLVNCFDKVFAPEPLSENLKQFSKTI